MLISIIIPVYNVEPYIVRCVESVLHQTYRNLEVILVDDCTPDRSMELAKERINTSLDANDDITFVYLKHDRNRGLSAARNTGMDAATGEYIYFLDSDDTISEDCIEKLVAPIKDYRYDFVIGDYSVIGSDRQYPPLNLQEGKLMDNVQIIKEYSSGNWYMMAVNKLFNVHYVRENKLSFMEGLIHEDELWSFMIACTAQSMYAVKTKGYFYYIHGNSITTVQTRKKKVYYYNVVLKEMYAFQKEKKLFNYNVERVILWFISRLLYNSKDIMSNYHFYLKIRKYDNRKLLDKLKSFPGLSLRIKYFDFFLKPSLGFFYRYCFWNAMRLKIWNKQLPFVY